MNNCGLCLHSRHQGSVEVWNKPLFESRNFIALPSLGALVEGWLLLLPKDHFICMGALPNQMAAELQEMKIMICSVLRKNYGEICLFEHGPSKPNGNVGCSVDHAHVHIVPISFDLSAAALPFLPQDASISCAGYQDCQDAFKRCEDYLYLEQPIGTGSIIKHPDIGSQIFRRAIAAVIGKPDQFNWRENLQIPTVSATIDKLRTQNESMFPCMKKTEIAA